MKRCSCHVQLNVTPDTPVSVCRICGSARPVDHDTVYGALAVPDRKGRKGAR